MLVFAPEKTQVKSWLVTRVAQMRLTFGMEFGVVYWIGWKFERQVLLSEAETEAKLPS